MFAHARLRAALALPVLSAALLTSVASFSTTASAAEPLAQGSGPMTVQRIAPMKVERRVVMHKVLWMTPVSSYHLTSRFGDASYMWSSGAHTGLDFAAPEGSPIRSITEGTVVESGWDGSYGYRTVVRLADGSEAWYCHQSAIAVQVGQHLDAGQLLGYVGSTGNVTGAHLHLEIRQGDTPVDPGVVLGSHGVNP